jgi:hypothetical protein
MTREDIIRMADASGLSLYGMGKDREQFIDYLECFAALVASAEREACANIADSQLRNTNALLTAPIQSSAAYQIGVAIRARKQA